MNCDFFRRCCLVATLLAGLFSPLIAPVTGAHVSAPAQSRQLDLQTSTITSSSTAQVKVTAGPTGVLVQWRTSFERDSLGFNLYREQAGARTQVNPSMIAGSAVVPEQATTMTADYGYQWFDAAGSLNSTYYLEHLDLSGKRTTIGPLTPIWNGDLTRVTPQAKLASEVEGQAASAQRGGPAGSFEPPALDPAAIQDQWAIAAQPGLKIGVRLDGWYRVTQPELVAAGFDVSGDAAKLRLFVDGREVPMEVSKSSGPLGAGDLLEFYGTGVDTLTTDTRVYYLINGDQAGLRIPLFGEIQVDDLPQPSPQSSPIGSSPKTNAGVWLGDLSTGVSAREEERPRRLAAVAGSTTEIVPSIVESGPPVSAGNVSRQRAASRISKVINDRAEPIEMTNVHRGLSVAMTSPAVSRGAGKQRDQIKHHRRRIKRHGRGRTLKRKRSHAVSAADATAGFLYEVQLKDRFVYFSSLLNGEAANYFGFSLITPPYTQQSAPTTRTLNLKDLQTDSQGTALLRIGLQGTSFQAHLVNVFVNDALVGSLSYDAQQYGEQLFPVAISQLREGANVIKFVTSDTNDRSLFSYARLTYPRIYRADNDTLSFALRPSQSMTINGFTTPNIRVLDISNPMQVQEVQPVVQAVSSGYALTVGSTGVRTKGMRKLLAQPSGSFLPAASLVSNQPSALNQAGSANSENAADFLIISHRSFLSLPSLATLVAQRQAQGLMVKVVDIEDVFDEFSYGAHTPQAIIDFLTRARATWVKAPRYLMLIGDASYDPRNFEGGGNFDLVPTKLIDTGFMETGSDDALTDFDGDGIPEIPVGRLPVRTVAEANLVLAKIVNFTPANVPQNALMVADTQGSYFFNFEQADDALIPLLPSNMQSNVRKVYRAQQPSDATARTNIINAINSGTALVNYSGHGNVDVWTGGSIFSSSDAMALTNNNKLPLVIVMDCLNGYFVAPPIDCISEALMKAPNGGAVASFSSSGLTIPTGQHEMGQKLFQLLYSGAPIALGDATRQAKAATTDIDVRRTWILFGDPTMKIR